MVQDKFPFLEGRELDKKLPQIFKNNKNTFIRDLLDCIKEEFNELQKTLVDVEGLVDYDNNSGYQLDLLGSNIKEGRDGESDTRYRARIKAMMYASNSLGDENTIINGMSSYLNIPPSAVGTSVVATRTIELRFPAVVSIKKTDKYIKRVKAAGIKYRIKVEVDVENTMNHFSAIYNHIDEEITADWRS
ncbi:MAG: hypothetical protein ACRCX2_12575 [Paraclostridium sp.]|uniref:hypothetical protein n=1 Tax=Cetobacterium sp. TaxID=2071632 RepID=UPI003F40875A